MKRVKDPNTGVIKYIPDESDTTLRKLSTEIKRISSELKKLENRVDRLEKGDI